MTIISQTVAGFESTASGKLRIVEQTVPRAKAPDHYIPSLDGIRALAVTTVFVAHAGLDRFIPGGFGVTVFFFLSGFLITSLLRREHEQHGFIHLQQFYLRRIIRIWPPMYLTLGIVVALSLLNAFQLAAPQQESLWFQMLHLANYQQIFGQALSIPGTEVLWSLAVEEHFYLFWPVVFNLLYQRLSPIQFAIFLSGLCCAFLAWRCVLVFYWHMPEWRTYVATDTRIDSIMFGCILALCYRPSGKVSVKGSCCIISGVTFGAATMLLAGFLIGNPMFRETFRYSLQGVALMPLFYLAVNYSDVGIIRCLNWPAVRFLGVLSYSIYLSHFFILSLLMRDRLSYPLVMAAAAAVMTIAYAIVVYRVVECPLLTLRRNLRS